ncbi:MAG: efflux RND transporter permease subunit [Acidobacteriota bacterium]|nr:efflux RND transporter permease subunit [Acidobacteriota bacterium]
MRLIEFSLKRRVTIAMGAVALVLFGLVAFQRLSINLLPDLSYPSLTVETRYPGAAPAEVESLVTRPIEEVVGVVSGVQRLTSVSRPGLSQVTLEFDWKRDMDFATLDVREKLDLIRLPEQAQEPVVLRFDPANDPILRLYLTGGESLYQLRYVGEEVVKKDLESTEGVAAIKVNGGYEEEVQVQVDEGKLALVGLTIQQVNDRLLAENVNQAGGSLYESEARYLVRANNEFVDLDDILQTVLTSPAGRAVRVADVATVTRGHKRREVVTRYGGREAVELAVYKEGDANTVQVAKAVRARLASIEDEVPEGIEIAAGVDQSKFIEASIREVLSNAGLGGLIAIVVLLFFLKDLRSTLIIGVSIPISIVTTFFLMYRTGTTLNIMSLGGLALGVGMLVDNAIVVLEAVYKHREAGKGAFAAARDGASEVGRAVIASTLTTVAVFLPVVFLEGVAAQLFRDMALTVSFSLLASLAIALTLIPMLAAAGGTARLESVPLPPAPGRRVRRFFWRLLVLAPSFALRGLRRALSFARRGLTMACRPLSQAFDAGLGAVSGAYPRALGWALGRKAVVVAAAAASFAGALALVPSLGFDLIPTFSQGEFSFFVELPEGTPLEVVDRYVAQVQEAVREDPRVASLSSIAGGRGLSLTSTGTEGENTARIQVLMAPGTGAEDEQAIADRLRGRLAQNPQVAFKFERPTYFSFRTPIEVEVYDDDLAELHDVAAVLQREIAAVPGLVDIESSAELGNPELQVRFDRDQFAQLELSIGDVADTIRSKVQGDVATRLTEGDREIDIVVRSVDVGSADVADIENFIVAQRHGIPVYLKSIARVEVVNGPSEIRRVGQKRAAVVSGNLDGRDMGAAAADVRAAVAGVALPATTTATLSGQEEERTQSLRSLALAMALAIFLVYLVMASQFESFLHPFIIIFTLPLGAIGVVLALAVTGNSVNIVAMIGAVMLAGIVVNNAIILIDAVNQRRRAGLAKRDALLAAGRDRLRPILMTSATTVLGLTPMALGLGEGAELRAPLAITVIGGLSVATLLTLVVIPVVYAAVDRRDVIAAPGAAGDSAADDAVPGPDETAAAAEA